MPLRHFLPQAGKPLRHFLTDGRQSVRQLHTYLGGLFNQATLEPITHDLDHSLRPRVAGGVERFDEAGRRFRPKPQPQRVYERYEPRAYKVRVPPATYACMSRKLRGFYGAKSLEEKPPMKLGKTFAQDDCLFYVIGKGNAPQGGR